MVQMWIRNIHYDVDNGQVWILSLEYLLSVDTTICVVLL